VIISGIKKGELEAVVVDGVVMVNVSV